MITQCEYCKTDFNCSTSKYNFNKKNNMKIFCSSKCYQNSKNTLKKDNCCQCGKEIFVTDDRKRRSKTGNVYCSKSCSTINNNKLFKKWTNHPRYTGGISKYREIKIKSMDTVECEKCGNNIECVLQVHHKDKNRRNNDLSNLALLCANCHLLEHCTD